MTSLPWDKSRINLVPYCLSSCLETGYHFSMPPKSRVPEGDFNLVSCGREARTLWSHWASFSLDVTKNNKEKTTAQVVSKLNRSSAFKLWSSQKSSSRLLFGGIFTISSFLLKLAVTLRCSAVFWRSGRGLSRALSPNQAPSLSPPALLLWNVMLKPKDVKRCRSMSFSKL